MRPFEHIDATSIDDAIDLLQSEPESALIAGGTDLLVLMKEGVLAPRLLVNIKSIAGLDRVAERSEGGIRVGPLVTMAQLAESQIIRARYSILVDAMRVAASPQLRNVATVAGNLCQRPRCWYYRESFDCFLRGGDVCRAVAGQSRDASVFGAERCYAVSPSDLAPALAALDASLVIQGPSDRREAPIREFYVDNQTTRNILGPHEMIVEILLPPRPGDSRGIYLKAMERKAWAFAQASVAIQLSRDADRVADIRVALGSVAPVPWRARGAEDVLRGNALAPETVDLAAAAAVADAQPLSANGYKVDLIKALLRRGLFTLANP